MSFGVSRCRGYIVGYKDANWELVMCDFEEHGGYITRFGMEMRFYFKIKTCPPLFGSLLIYMHISFPSISLNLTHSHNLVRFGELMHTFHTYIYMGRYRQLFHCLFFLLLFPCYFSLLFYFILLISKIKLNLFF